MSLNIADLSLQLDSPGVNELTVCIKSLQATPSLTPKTPTQPNPSGYSTVSGYETLFQIDLCYW